ncbi:hypothetical protein I302_101380 [Kwoniella bestiolae CBS 10118]|uniref:Uncharacterized protein n=1 Tax=Kwoniella bestiolae CBS 10118 TaxID=1296100 RepID=A0A1B9GC45_9TREE|nr:hypothetical protein I302_00063 [Kwoniella bestiolae CBS 10118]OCF28575.1 hypothetical protein I302_00063 [Kwoniella bestiolae CBS 10118]
MQFKLIIEPWMDVFAQWPDITTVHFLSEEITRKVSLDGEEHFTYEWSSRERLLWSWEDTAMSPFKGLPKNLVLKPKLDLRSDDRPRELRESTFHPVDFEEAFLARLNRLREDHGTFHRLEIGRFLSNRDLLQALQRAVTQGHALPLQLQNTNNDEGLTDLMNYCAPYLEELHLFYDHREVTVNLFTFMDVLCKIPWHLFTKIDSVTVRCRRTFYKHNSSKANQELSSLQAIPKIQLDPSKPLPFLHLYVVNSTSALTKSHILHEREVLKILAEKLGSSVFYWKPVSAWDDKIFTFEHKANKNTVKKQEAIQEFVNNTFRHACRLVNGRASCGNVKQEDLDKLKECW